MTAAGDSLDWFVSPGPDFRMAAFWFWHRIPTNAEIGAQLADMKAKGIGTVMIQARRSLPLEQYLSPDYLAAYRLAAAEMKRLGLRLTIYDEYCWMSGHGGGLTVDGADHLRERHLFWTSSRTTGSDVELAISNIRSPFHDFLGEAGKSWIYEQGGARWGNWEVVAVLVHPGTQIDRLDDVEILPATRAVVQATGQRSCCVRVDTGGDVFPGCTVTVLVAARCMTSRMINYLLPEAAQRFAEKVHVPLIEASAGAATAVFFDHPYAGFYVWDEHAGDLGNSLLWDDTLRTFAEPLRLFALLRDVGPETARLRADFFREYQSRLHEAFFGTLSRWTRERGLDFTGHELLTHVGAWGLQSGLGGFDPRTMPGVDYFGIDAYRSLTSVDAADYQPQLSAKLGDSVARANGRKRCTIEQYSTGRETGMQGLAGQWGLTAERFRAQAIRHLLLGARQILLHAVNVTDGCDDDPRLFLNPRFDFPPGFNFEPWWEDCPAIFNELARLSAFLEDGEPLRPVALFYPLETIRAGTMAPPCAEQFGWWAEALTEAGLGYSVVDERQIRRALNEGGRYEALVLPAVSTFALSGTEAAIAGFVAAGGLLLMSEGEPYHASESEHSHACRGPMARLSGCDDRLVRIPDATRASVAGAVARLPRPRPDMRFDQGPTFASVTRCGEGWRFAVFNDQPVTRTLSLTLDGPPEGCTLWDASTGDVGSIEMPEESSVRFELGAHRLLCMSVGNEEPEVPPAARHLSFSGRMARRSASDRIVLDDGWTVQIGVGNPVPIAVDRGWEAQGWPTYAGTGIYRRKINLPRLPQARVWTLVLPSVCYTADVFINGTPHGRHLAGEARFELTNAAGEIDLELHVRNTAANRYYAATPFRQEPQPSGLTQAPYLLACAGSACDLGRFSL